jgi:hypothetical protein
MRKIIVNQKLNTYKIPDTSTKILGQVEAGSYQLVEYKNNMPSASTDYALITEPTSRLNVWICARYNAVVYAKIGDESIPLPAQFDFDSDCTAIDEKQLISLLPDFYKFCYDLQHPTYPYSLKGCIVPLSPPYQNNYL